MTKGGETLIKTLGVSLHCGPDYESEPSSAGRRSSFFATGPQLGAYVGLDYKRPGERFNLQPGFSPYAALLFGIDDPDGHRGGRPARWLAAILDSRRKDSQNNQQREER